MRRLNWSNKARADLQDILGYIANRNPDAALRLQSMIEQAAQQLLYFPYLYRTGRVAGTREAVVRRNYILIYRVEVEAIRIIAVLHARRNYPSP